MHSLARPSLPSCQEWGHSIAGARFSRDAVVGAWKFSIGAIGSDCCCADRYLRFSEEARHMHGQRVVTWRLGLVCGVADDLPLPHELLPLPVIERR